MPSKSGGVLAKKEEDVSDIFLLTLSYCEIEPVGQVAAHAPHSTHISGLISYFPSPSLIAPTGHSPAQAPQDTQPSLITRAIVVTSFVKKTKRLPLVCSYFNTKQKNKQEEFYENLLIFCV